MKAREAGQGLVEYALILVLVAVVVIVMQNLLGPAYGNIFSTIITSLDTGTGTSTTAFDSGDLGTLAGSTNCPEAEREARETLLALGEEFGQHDEGVDESAILLIGKSLKHRTNPIEAIAVQKGTLEPIRVQVLFEPICQVRQPRHSMVVTDGLSSCLPDMLLWVQVRGSDRIQDDL
jgi:pilus assembly protein Flp/PilA